MPDYTVSGDVDSMLRSANDAAIRSAIGVGTTDAPTFLAQTLTGQSLTGTQATSLVDLSATWNTTGNPTAIKLNLTNTASGASSNLMDLQIDGISKVRTSKGAELKLASGGSFALTQNGSGITGNRCILLYDSGVPTIATAGQVAWSQGGDAGASVNTFLTSDAAGILAQRNGVNAQAFRVYNAYHGTTADEWLEIDWKTTGGTVKIGANRGATGGARALALSIDGAPVFGLSATAGASNAWWSITRAAHLLCAADNAYDIGASGANRPRNIYVGASIFCASDFNGERDIYCGIGRYFRFNVNGTTALSSSAAGVVTMADLGATNTTPRITLGGTTSAFPAIKRNGTAINIVLADDSGFAPLSAAGITGASFLCSALGGNGFSTTGGGFIIHTAANKLRLSGSADTTGGSLLLDTADVIQVRNLANTAAGFIQGKLRTETAYTATVVAATGYITLYDSTGTAYRVPCAV